MLYQSILSVGGAVWQSYTSKRPSFEERACWNAGRSGRRVALDEAPKNWSRYEKTDLGVPLMCVNGQTASLSHHPNCSGGHSKMASRGNGWTASRVEGSTGKRMRPQDRREGWNQEYRRLNGQHSGGRTASSPGINRSACEKRVCSRRSMW